MFLTQSLKSGGHWGIQALGQQDEVVVTFKDREADVAILGMGQDELKEFIQNLQDVYDFNYGI